MLLSLTGGAGFTGGRWLRAPAGKLVPLSLAAWAHPQIDNRALSFALVTCVLAAIAFALAGQRVIMADSSAAVRISRASISADKRLIRSVLVASQIAFATVILIATSLLGQTFYKLAHDDLGFNPEHVLTMRTEMPRSEVSPYQSFAARDRFYKGVIERVQRLPGVTAAGYTTYLPLTNRNGGMGIIQEGAAPPAPGQWNDVMVRVVSPGYFNAIGVRLVSRRFLSERDDIARAPSAVISESMSRKYWAGLDPIGRRFRFDDPQLPYFTVMGVVADIHFSSIEATPSPMVYLSSLQDVPVEAVFYPRDLAIRTAGDPATYIAAVRQCIWSVDSEQAISSVQTRPSG